MTAEALLSELRSLGASVAAVGGRLRIEAPAGTMTPEIREALTTYKTELLALLSSAACQPCEHAAHDSELADWYRRNPHLTCARCFLAGASLRSWVQ